jgi:hypothetical protein
VSVQQESRALSGEAGDCFRKSTETARAGSLSASKGECQRGFLNALLSFRLWRFQQSFLYSRIMNPLIVTNIIAPATFIISIFGASWLNQQAMIKRLDDLRGYLDARFTAIEQTMGARFDAVDARFDAVDQRIGNLERRVERVERQLDTVFKPSLPR